MSYNLLENHVDVEAFVPPVPYEDNIPHASESRSYFIQSRKALIFIGVIFLMSLSVLVIILTKISLSRSKPEQPFEQRFFPTKHTATPTITTAPMTMNHKKIPTCNISFTNATWEKDGITFVNRYGKCSSDDDALCQPQDLFIDDVHDNLYVVDSNNSRIQKYSLNQPVSDDQSAIGITVASQNLIYPSSIFVDTQTEDMYILDYDKYKDNKYSDPPSYRVHFWPKNANIGRILFTERGENGIGWDSHMVLDKHMDIYVGTRYHIRKWLLSTNYTHAVTVAGAKGFGGNSLDALSDPHGLCIDNDLTMYIADWNNGRVVKWMMNADQGIILVSDIHSVYGITQDCNGNLYYSDAWIFNMYQLNLETNQSRIIISKDENIRHGEDKGFFTPLGMKLDKFGNMFFIDIQHSRIKKFSIL